jgi:membrane-bound lytic murein transglycosylase MltF
MQKEKEKIHNLTIASNYFLFFYGQFAIEKMDLDLKDFIKTKFKENKKIGQENQEQIFAIPLFALFMLSKDENESVSKEILRIITKSENITDSDKLKIFYFIKQKEKNYYSTLVKVNEPFVGAEEFYELKNVTKNPFLHALIKKESNFGKRSKSNKGARGMMQIMPQTAMIIAKNLNIKYDVYRLLVDDFYNLIIGVKYLDMLFKKYNNHKILTLAAYNAGPGRVDRWVDKKGDPREATEIIDIILWTEKIPIKETRDYVKKIIESEAIYEIRYQDQESIAAK